MPLLALLTFTFAALLAGLIVGALLNRSASERRIDGEVARLFAEIDTLPTYYAEAELDGLPAPVQRFLARNLHDGAPHPSCLRTREAGRVRQRPGQPWTEFVAESYTVAGTPALLWFARLRPLPLVWVDARTLYLRGRGYETTRLLSSIRAIDSQDDATRSAVLIQYLAELPLVPGALLPADDRGWQPVDEHAARFELRDGELRVAGVFEFDELGNIVRFVSEDRPYRGPLTSQPGSPARWVVRYSEHRSFNELELPTRIDVEWQLGEQTFAYLEKTLEAIEHDIPRRFGASESKPRNDAASQ
jgi:hypothetical protein